MAEHCEGTDRARSQIKRGEKRKEGGNNLIEECFLRRCCARVLECNCVCVCFCLNAVPCASQTRRRPLQAMGVVPRHSITVQLCCRNRWRLVYGMCICMHAYVHEHICMRAAHKHTRLG